MYDDLTAKMDDIDVAISNGFGKASVFLACVKATRATIELHKPQEITLPDGEWGANCKICDDGYEYPCATIKAITKAFDDSQAN
jgi:hypothetical protein